MTDLINQLRVYCSTLSPEHAREVIAQTRTLVSNMEKDLMGRFTYRFNLVQLYPFNNFAPARLVGPGITLVLNGVENQHYAPRYSFGARYLFATLVYIGEKQCDPTTLKPFHIDKHYDMPPGWIERLEILNNRQERVYPPALTPVDTGIVEGDFDEQCRGDGEEGAGSSAAPS